MSCWTRCARVALHVLPMNAIMNTVAAALIAEGGGSGGSGGTSTLTGARSSSSTTAPLHPHFRIGLGLGHKWIS